MKKIIKISVLIVIVLILSVLFNVNKVNAVLQSNGNTPTSQYLYNWGYMVRNMEKMGGTFNLNATVNTTTLLETSEANNLDVHTQLNTEYGAMAILSASSYGNPNKINAGETTTGNSTGLVITLNPEWVMGADLSVASGSYASGTTWFRNINSKYKNQYATSAVAKIGDATTETAGWHGGKATWVKDNWRAAFVRENGSIFSYDTAIAHSYYETGTAYPTRAVIIVGEGI